MDLALILKILEIATAAVTGASVLLAVVAKYTSNKTDDQVSGVLLKVKTVLEKLSLNVKDV